MAIRSEVFQRGVRFDTTIGPCGTNYPMGSETELVKRLCGKEGKAWHVSGAIVEHFIRDYQMQKSWVYRRAVRYGRGMFRLFEAPGLSEEIPCWFGVPRFLIRRLIEKGFEAMRASLGPYEQKAFRTRWDFNYFLGDVVEAHALSEKRGR